MRYKYEVIQYNDKLPIKIIMINSIKNYRNGYISPHWHDSYELIYLKTGQGNIIVDGKHFVIKKDHFFLVNPNVVHSISYDHQVDEEVIMQMEEGVIIQIPQKFFEEYINDESEIQFYCSEDGANKDVLCVLDQLCMTLDYKDYGYTLALRSLIFKTLHLLLTQYKVNNSSGLVKKSKKSEQKITKILKYMRDHYDDNLKLENVAEHFDLSLEYLSRFIKKSSGMNFKEILTLIRLDYAYKELLNTDYPMLDIALKAGFPSTKAFNNSFTKKYGCLPSEYRKSQKSDTN